MCVIVDTCCISKVFNVNAKEHSRFELLYAWINGKNGRLVFGGTKYKKEIRPMKNFLKLLLDYERQGKVSRVADSEVDAFALKAKEKVVEKDFNDEHLVGIVAVSRCCVICTDDTTAIPFITRPELYSALNMRPPRIYSRRAHKALYGAGIGARPRQKGKRRKGRK